MYKWSRRFEAESREFAFEITITIYSNIERSEQFLVTELFFNLFLEIFIFNELEQLEFKLKKKILGFRNMQEKLEKWTVPTKMPKPAFTCSFFVCIEFNRCSKMSRPGPTKNKTLSAKQTSGLPFWKKRKNFWCSDLKTIAWEAFVCLPVSRW